MNATRRFRSTWRKHDNPDRILLIIPKEYNVVKDLFIIRKNEVSIRIIPYPPNFNRIPARIIDPAIGASTWALGNQM